MLKQRVITAVILLAVVVALLASPPPWFVLALLVFFGVGAGEWAKLTGGSSPVAAGVLIALGLASMFLPLQTWWPAWDSVVKGLLVLASAYWLFGGAWSVLRVQRLPGGAPLAMFLFWAAWAAAAALYSSSIALLLTAMLVVWSADTLAYFAGRAFGKHKLAPKVSPGKTWEGAVGGLVGVLLIGYLTTLVVPHGSFFGVCLERYGWPLTVAIMVVLTAVSILGDLHESLLKRVAGVKDSGTLLPGHGGVLDRVDALIAVLPMAALVCSW